MVSRWYEQPRHQVSHSGSLHGNNQSICMYLNLRPTYCNMYIFQLSLVFYLLFSNIWILVKRIRVLPTNFVHMMCHHVVCNNFSGSKIGIFSHKIAIECWLRLAPALATNDDDDVMMMMLIWLASRCSLLLASHAKCDRHILLLSNEKCEYICRRYMRE